jgi:alpha-galactosidase
VSAEDVRNNLNAIQNQRTNLPLDLVQLDDGFETQAGDWFDFRPSFPEGVRPLSNEIRRAGLTPGLWLAPFIVHPKSNLSNTHPDWLLRGRRGRPVNAGFVWNSLCQALDLTIPEALEYACQVLRTAVQEWGYPYLKLDFLYAAALEGVYADPTRTRAQVLRTGMQALRDAVGEDTYLLGCGAPLGSVLGIADAMRIGPDVSGSWAPEFHAIRFPFKNEPGMPCARNSIHNILTRAPLHNRWWVNDPDCLLVRADTDLTLQEIQSLATSIALTGGMLLLSDDLSALPPERLRIAEVLLPSVGKSADVLDLFERTTPQRLRLDMTGPFGPWSILAQFNWSDRPVSWTLDPIDFSLPEANYVVSSFWDGYQGIAKSKAGSSLPDISPHGVALLSVYPFDPGEPGMAGSSLHFSQGSEISTWERSPGKLKIGVSLGRSGSGWVGLTLPSPPTSSSVNNRPSRWESAGDGIYRFYLDCDKDVLIEVKY